MIKTIDCRNLPCPAPVISVKKALEEHSEFRILLDDGAPRENVSRFARNRGCQLREERNENGWAITITAGDQLQTAGEPTVKQGDTVLLITSNLLGNGPEELGKLLMKNFIHTLLETSETPAKIYFMNSGVLLTTEGSDLLEALDKLGNMGVEVMSCGLCLDFFGVKDKLRTGSTTNMLVTAESLLKAGKLIKL